MTGSAAPSTVIPMKPASQGSKGSTRPPEPGPPTAFENAVLESQVTIRDPNDVDDEDDAEIARVLGLAPEPHAISDLPPVGLRTDPPPEMAQPTPAPRTHQGTARPGPASFANGQLSGQNPPPVDSDASRLIKSPGPEIAARPTSRRGLRTAAIVLSLMVLCGTSTYVILEVTSPGKTAPVASPSSSGILASKSKLSPPSPTVRNTPVHDGAATQTPESLKARLAESLPPGEPTPGNLAVLPTIVGAPQSPDAAVADRPEQAVATPEPTKPPPELKNELEPKPPEGELVEQDITKYASASASSTLPADVGFTFVPRNLVDARLDTSWQASAKSREGVGESFTLRFGRAHLISSLKIANGFQFDWNGKDLFLMNARLAIVTIDLGDRTDRFSFESGARGYVSIPIEPPVKTSRITVRAITVHSGWRWPDLAVSDVRVIALTPAR